MTVGARAHAGCGLTGGIGMPWVRAPQEAVRLKVTLKGLKPPVWRRIVAEDTMTLGELHMAVQAAMLSLIHI